MNSLFNSLREETDAELRRIFERRSDIPQILLESMTYSVYAGGKRLRPILVLASAEAVGGDRASALPIASALELIHTYTLIHDDLPAMDDDDLRRGMPTNHKKFGEATAILAGDGLLTLAFEVMTEQPANGTPLSADVQIKAIQAIAKAVGAQGTVGGQEVDMESENAEGNLDTLEYIHTRKTGAMITVACTVGGLIGGASEAEQAQLAIYGDRIGHAFQIVDDILDVTGDTGTLGKTVGSDHSKKKMTYPSLLGLDESRKLADRMISEALSALEGLTGDTAILAAIANYIGKRDR